MTISACYSTVKKCVIQHAAVWNTQVKAQADGKTGSGELAPVNLGPRYEQHVHELQKQLEDATGL